MAETSRLENVAIDYRDGKIESSVMSAVYKDEEGARYGIDHKNAKADGDAKGKGVGGFDTTRGGGLYDEEGTKGVEGAFQGDAGRNNIIRYNEYSQEDNAMYSVDHKNATSDGDVKGKGTHKPMTHAIRDLNAPKTQMNYSTLDTENGGSSKDIEMRDKANVMNFYSREKEYGRNSIKINKIYNQ